MFVDVLLGTILGFKHLGFIHGRAVNPVVVQYRDRVGLCGFAFPTFILKTELAASRRTAYYHRLIRQLITHCSINRFK